jgi:Flp pilus assembly protein CpaB
MRSARRQSLNPSALTRLRQALQPDWVHTVAVRRTVAAALVLLAALAAWRSDPQGDHADTVVAARDLTPGAPLHPDDIRIERRLASTVPDGAHSTPDAVLGATPAGPIRRGEVLTDVRLLGARLAQAAAGPTARVVPLRLADVAVLDLVRAGDVVDILGASTSDADPAPHVIATDAVVVSVSDRPKAITAAADRVVLVALPAAAANAVAGATLVQAVTLTLH